MVYGHETETIYLKNHISGDRVREYSLLFLFRMYAGFLTKMLFFNGIKRGCFNGGVTTDGANAEQVTCFSWRKSIYF